MATVVSFVAPIVVVKSCCAYYECIISECIISVFRVLTICKDMLENYVVKELESSKLG